MGTVTDCLPDSCLLDTQVTRAVYAAGNDTQHMTALCSRFRLYTLSESHSSTTVSEKDCFKTDIL